MTYRQGAGRRPFPRTVHAVGVCRAGAVSHAPVRRVDDELRDPAQVRAAVGGEPPGGGVFERLLVVAGDPIGDVLRLGPVIRTAGSRRP